MVKWSPNKVIYYVVPCLRKLQKNVNDLRDDYNVIIIYMHELKKTKINGMCWLKTKKWGKHQHELQMQLDFLREEKDCTKINALRLKIVQN